jgi:hypothetical protein
LPATAITAATRYFRPGLTAVVFAPAVANKAAPTRAEINAGTDLSRDVQATDGFSTTANFLDAPDLVSSFVSKVAGTLEAGDSSITMYQSSNSVDARSLMPRGTTGFILWFDESDTPGRKADTFPITVASVSKQRDIAAIAVIQFAFAISSAPAVDWTVPA